MKINLIECAKAFVVILCTAAMVWFYLLSAGNAFGAEKPLSARQKLLTLVPAMEISFEISFPGDSKSIRKAFWTPYSDMIGCPCDTFTVESGDSTNFTVVSADSIIKLILFSDKSYNPILAIDFKSSEEILASEKVSDEDIHNFISFAQKIISAGMAAASNDILLEHIRKNGYKHL